MSSNPGSSTTRGKITAVAVGVMALAVVVALLGGLALLRSSPSVNKRSFDYVASYLGQSSPPDVRSIACPSAGDCSISGNYYDSYQTWLPFVASESHGVWSAPKTFNQLANFQDGEIRAISCSSPGNCAGSGYVDGPSELFAVSERHYVWLSPQLTYTNVNDGGFANPNTLVSCAPDGSCTALYQYSNNTHQWLSEVSARAGANWSKPRVVARLNLNFPSQPQTIRCSRFGDCTLWAAGLNGGQGYRFVERDGAWSRPTLVNSLMSEALRSASSGDAGAVVPGCLSPTTCFVWLRTPASKYYVETVRRGSIVTRQQIDLSRFRYRGHELLPDFVSGVSCTQRHYCIAAITLQGYAYGRMRHVTSLPEFMVVATSTNGRWSLPATLFGNPGRNQTEWISADSCPRVGACSVAGAYFIGGKSVAFVEQI